MYLESIYVLSKTNSGVHAIDVSEHIGYSKPSVSRAMSILKKDEYITVDNDGHIHLTEKGLSVAESIYERHMLLTEMLTRLGVDPDVASVDACKIDHVLSDASFDAIKKHFSK